MKITIESTDMKESKSIKASVELLGQDDADIHEVMQLIKQCLLGYGYSESSVEEYIGG